MQPPGVSKGLWLHCLMECSLTCSSPVFCSSCWVGSLSPFVPYVTFLVHINASLPCLIICVSCCVTVPRVVTVAVLLCCFCDHPAHPPCACGCLTFVHAALCMMMHDDVQARWWMWRPFVVSWPWCACPLPARTRKAQPPQQTPSMFR